MKKQIKDNKLSMQKVFSIILALILSIFLWVYVNESEGDVYTATFTGVKVVFEGEENMRNAKNLIITSQDTTSVRVKITGDRRVVANLDDADLTAVIDLSSISRTGNHTQNYKINYPSGVDSSSLTVDSEYPSSISFFVDKLSTKSVPVKGVFNGNPAEGFSIEPLEFNPATVQLYGPETELAKVDHAYIEISREDVNKTQTFDMTYILRDKDNEVVDSDAITLVEETVTVTLPVIAVKTVSLTLDFVFGNGIKEENVKVTIEPATTITLTGDSAVLEGRNNITLDTIDLADIDASFSKTYTIVIPNDTEIVEGPKEVSVLVEIIGLETKVFNISKSNISYINNTAGFNAEIMSESITGVKIRGSAEAILAISAANIYAVADLSEFGNATGIVSAPVKIYVDGVDAGAVGDYTVYVNITKSDESAG